MKTILSLLFTLNMVIMAASVMQVNGTFTSPQPTNLPDGWDFHGWVNFKPHPRVTITPGKQGNILRLHDIRGKSGTAIRSRRRMAAKPGDMVTGTILAKGKGTAYITLYLYHGKDGWGNEATAYTIRLTPQWTRHRFMITVPEGQNRQTESIELVLGASHGTDVAFSELEASLKETDYCGAYELPVWWHVFAPMDKSFVPSPDTLRRIPDTLNGVAWRKMKRQGHVFDFQPYFRTKGQGNCAWIFANIKAQVDSDYTIGAGADWWMCVYLNGKPVIDTMSHGNESDDFSIRNYVRKVRLKKGDNLLAVRFVSGDSSAILRLGGPSELRDLNLKLVPRQILAKDDFETPGRRSGNPTRIKGQVTPLILVPNTEALYGTRSNVTILSEDTGFRPASMQAEDYLTAGLVLRKLGKAPCALVNRLSWKSHALQSVIRRDRAGDAPQWALELDGRTVATWDFPIHLLPAETYLSLNRAGECVLVATSLSGMSISVKTKLPAILAPDEPITREIQLAATGSKLAQAWIDDLFYGIYDRLGRREIPSRIALAPDFNPVREGWKLIFEDDFNGPELDTSKWSNHRQGTDDLISFKDGKLHLTCAWDPKTKWLKVPSLHTTRQFQFGYFEARVRFTQQPGWWAAFWLCNEFPTNNVDGGFEIDIFEDMWHRAGSRDKRLRLDHTLHGFYGKNLLKSWSYHCYPEGSRQDFHTIACRWTPFEIVIYLDGKALPAQANHSPHKVAAFDAFNHFSGIAPLEAILSGTIPASLRKSVNPKNFPEDYVIDYVRIYEMPRSHAPQITWNANTDRAAFVKSGDMMTFEVDVEPDPETQSPVIGVYLFDNGSLIDFRTAPPYRFEIPFQSSFYDTTGYVVTGIQHAAPNIYTTTHKFVAYAQDAAGHVAFTPYLNKIPVRSFDNLPHQGRPATVPGTIKMTDYDRGGPYVSWFDVYPGTISSRRNHRNDGGMNTNGKELTHPCEGEWVKYTVNVTQAGTYRLDLNYTMTRPTVMRRQFVKIYLDNTLLDTLEMPVGKVAVYGKRDTLPLEARLPEGIHTVTLEFGGMCEGFTLKDLVFTLR